MDWLRPTSLLLLLPAAALLLWFHRGSLHPMSLGRRRLLTALRAVLTILILLALAGPAWEEITKEEAVIFIMDHSQSQGESGMDAAFRRAADLAAQLPEDTLVGVVSAGASTKVLKMPARDHSIPPPDKELMRDNGAQTDLAAAVSLAGGLFPSGTARRLVLVTDGVETRCSLESACRDAALSDIVIDAVPAAGEARPDVRVVRLRSSRSRLHEGAGLRLSADIQSSLNGEGLIRLFENGIEVESRPLRLEVGRQSVEEFQRTPDRRNLYTYRVRLEGFEGDTLPDNNEAMTLVEVRGRPLLLYVEGEAGEAHYLAEAMEREGIRLDMRPPQSLPENLQDLAGYDAVILSDVPARLLTERSMDLIRDYVEQLGGGFLMIGGMNSFGVGGYYRTPIEDILPVKMKAPDQEERYATALALVIDRSGSMSGQKIEICKSAAIATAELLTRKDYIGVVAFDSQATWIVPMTRLTSQGTVASQIATINAGGGTNMQPGMTNAYEALRGVHAKVKHMIVLTDGHTAGGGYQSLAAQILSEGITISTVGIGAGADLGLLQTVANAGGGDFYSTSDPTTIPRIFTQDTMVHMGRLIREESFVPKQVERHPMLKGWSTDGAPPLMGYVKTNRKATSQVPLVTDLGDPLLAHWRFGLGKVTAFTSDCKTRWSALWITGWHGYSQFWAQILRETAREPEGRHMDMRIDEDGKGARILVDLLEDAAQYRNEAAVGADVYFVPARALGSSLKHLTQVELDQTGPGCYEGRFDPNEPGVYLVRARAGAEMVSAGLVHNVSGEAATGQVDTGLLEKASYITGGTLLKDVDQRLPPSRTGHSRFVELYPYLLRMLLVLFLIDLAVRRWENVLGMAEWVGGIFSFLKLPFSRERGGSS